MAQAEKQQDIVFYNEDFARFVPSLDLRGTRRLFYYFHLTLGIGLYVAIFACCGALFLLDMNAGLALMSSLFSGCKENTVFAFFTGTRYSMQNPTLIRG